MVIDMSRIPRSFGPAEERWERHRDPEQIDKLSDILAEDLCSSLDKLEVELKSKLRDCE